MSDDSRNRGLGGAHPRPTTPCPDRTVLADLVHHPEALSAEQRALFVHHLASCARCMARSLEMEGLESDDPRGEDTLAMYLRFAEAKMMIGDRYRIREPLGRGGMGEVYRAEDTVLARQVAIKLVDIQWLRREGGTELALRENETRFGDRLLREAKVMARLKHPNLCALVDVVPFGGELAIVMEYIPGVTLTQWLGVQRRSWREVVNVFLAAGEGLWAAHQAGLVHRDFKPDNVLMGDGERVVVTDFGLARPVSELRAASAGPGRRAPEEAAPGAKAQPRAVRDTFAQLSTTSLHGLIGTRAYVAPEQRSHQAQDERADQYSFCVALYEALYGQRPYAQEEADEGPSQTGPSEPTPPEASEVPARLWPILQRGLCREPAGRFPSMQALLRELRREPVTAALSRRPREALKRRLWVVGTAAAAGVLLTAVGTSAWMAAAARMRCQVPPAPFAAIWDDGVTSEMGTAFFDAEVDAGADAGAAFDRVAERLDDYTRVWHETYEQTCAAHVEGGLSAEALRLRQICLEDQRRSVQALTEIMVEEVDGKILNHAVKAAWLLAPPEHCLETYKLSGFTALAMNESRMTNREERERLQLQIKRACIFHDLAKYEQGRRVAQSAIHAIEANASYGALMPEALFCLAWNQHASGAYNDALESARRAERLAAYFGNGALYGSMSAQLAWWTAYLREPQEVLAMVSHVNPDLVPEQASEQYDYAYAVAAMGVAKAREGAFDEAASLLRRSVVLLDGILGPQSPQAITLRTHLGRILRDAGRPQAAVTVLEEALDYGQATLTRHHRSLGRMMELMADAFRKLGRQAEALAIVNEALSIQRAALGPHHPFVANAEKQLAYLWIDQGEPERARPLLAHALWVMEQSLGRDSDSAGDVLVGWGRVYLASRDFRQAIAAFERAIALLNKDPGSAWTRAEAQLGLATALWQSGQDPRRAKSLAAEGRRYFQRHDGEGRFVASTGALEAAETIR